MQITIPPIATIFNPIADWRKPQGKRYSLISLLNFITMAMLCGKTSTRSMARWGKYLPLSSKKRLGIDVQRHPSAAMLCRVFWQIRAEELEEYMRIWVNQVHQELVTAGIVRGIAIDGKSIRRAASLGSPNAFLVAAVCHQLRLVLNQTAVNDKTNEISCVPALLERLLLKGLVITVDALLTQRAIVRQIRQAGGHYLMYVKGNQPRLLWSLEARFAQSQLANKASTNYSKNVNKEHGRLEIRELWTATAAGDYPHWPDVAQVFCLRRRRWALKAKKFSDTYVYGITSLSPAETSPADLITITRDHWAAIENGLHWVRDVLMGEDASSTRKPGAPQVRAIFRNIVINLARMAGFPSISEAIDAFSADSTKSLALLGL
jgi:predicted transposase YbfD/YdcC